MAEGSAAAGLAHRVRRTGGRRRLAAALLVMPLFVFLLVGFVGPIAALLARGVQDTEVPRVLPRVTAALAEWDGRGLPDDAAFAALVEDLRAARAAGTLAQAATRLNYDINGFRTLMFATARRLPVPGEDARAALIAADPAWGERATWAAIRRAAGPVTDFYLLAALDLKRDTDGAIVAAPAEQAIFLDVLARTFGISALVTLLCLAAGYPVAALLASLEPRRAAVLFAFVLLPFWTSLLVRTAAWVVLLQREGVVNAALLGLGLVEAPLQMIFTRFAVVLAMAHILLPFMILPLYAVMRAIPPGLGRAAASLGAPPWLAFLRVTWPLSLPGVAAGSLMVFIQALGYYITPALLGGASDQMISWFIAFYASRTVNWGMAAALSALLLVATAALYAVYARLAGETQARMA
ncbi:ABC transporter permease [Elioraea sp. Yellowstone]|jgi:putative spermidine/putrescine transport system permease protein|uniref:ABC transporter permease n=1 Tax=Elioraea sp. Yellowstone TaxID=2592070 RepID=UPI001150DB81|nr:ABC transporter permease [Elioraea sp. Yellowstone]TQF84470.1 ABC transporter permease [Elioraea sp. Yellowstone]